MTFSIIYSSIFDEFLSLKLLNYYETLEEMPLMIKNIILNLNG